MYISRELGLPTAFNYIVKFNPEEHPEIVKNYPTTSAKDSLQPVGIVSIDFLQNRPAPKKVTQYRVGSEIIERISEISQDQLIPFSTALELYGYSKDNLDGSNNLVENWINVADMLIRKDFGHLPREQLNKIIAETHTTMVKSFLLKDTILGDADFTAFNGGLVVNKDAIEPYVGYATNHDFGESMNKLIKCILNPDPYYGMTKEQFEKLSPSMQLMIKANHEKYFGAKTVDEAAQLWATSISERNFKYILKNFPEACEEFFVELDLCVQNSTISKIVDKYPNMTVNGTPLLTKKEATTITDYLLARIAYTSNMYIEYLKKTGKKVPVILETKGPSIQ